MPMMQDTPQTKYNKQYLTTITLRLNKKTDADILNKLDNVPNKQGYIKQLIRQDIATNTSENK